MKIFKLILFIFYLAIQIANRIYAVTLGAEEVPKISINEAVDVASSHLLNFNISNHNLFYATISRSSDDFNKKWITVWYPSSENNDGSQPLVISIEMNQTKKNSAPNITVLPSTGFTKLLKVSFPFSFIEGIQTAENLRKKLIYSTNYHIERCGYGKVLNDNNIHFFVQYIPEIGAKDTINRPLIMVNSTRQARLYDGHPTWIAIDKLKIQTRLKLGYYPQK